MDFLLEQPVAEYYHHAAFPVAFMTAELYVLQLLGCSNRHCSSRTSQCPAVGMNVTLGRGNLGSCAQADGCR